ncbi:MAG TPA: hypothetical protein VFZ65_03170 [Planctomycetota bacterium]|nr:hypothetical protein [Planctomycetota bacterium]
MVNDDPIAPEPAGDPPPPPPDASPSPRRERIVDTAPLAAPFGADELSASLVRPARMLDVVLGERQRLAANLRSGQELRALLAALFTCSVLFAIPYGLVDGWGRVLHVAMLFLGSVLLCVPSLLVFSSYLGVRMHWSQHLAIAMIIPAAAALFTLGFAPIYWFLDYSMPADEGVGGSATRVVLLVFALLLALSHLNRCLFVDAGLKALRDNWPLWVGWQLLLVFLTYRMARVLGMFQ